MSRTESNWTEGDIWEIDQGWDVFGADGEKVGDVSDVEEEYLTVSKGWLFPTERYIPAWAIARVEHDRVYLSVSKDEIESRGWDTVPETGIYEQLGHRRERTATETEYSTERPVDYAEREREFDATEVDRETLHVPVAEEELHVRTRGVEQGRVRLRKRVIEEQQTVSVPLREEEVHVERHAVDRPYGAGQLPGDAFEEREIEIPVYGEEAEVAKEAVVREEVEISKDVVERQERVSDTVRREEVHVEGEDVQDFETTRDR